MAPERVGPGTDAHRAPEWGWTVESRRLAGRTWRVPAVVATFAATCGGAQGSSLSGIDERYNLAARRLAAVRYHFVAVEVRAGSLTVSAVDVDGSLFDRAVLIHPPRITRARSAPGPGPP